MFSALLSIVVLAANQQFPSEAERRMIAEAQEIVRSKGDMVWAGLSQAPLPVVLIGPEQEALFCGLPTDGFIAAGFDPLTRCSMQTRPRELPVDLAASTFLGDSRVIQMGLPAALDATKADWIVTFLHEVFHQYQEKIAAYEAAVGMVRERLGQTGGQWMLDYQFPYSDPGVKAAFSKMTASALLFLEASTAQQAEEAIVEYVRARESARKAAGADNWLYYEFQVGQEGVAHWSELRLAAIAGETSPEIAAIAQERSGGLAASLRAIDRQGVDVWKRSVFYVLGAIEASMLEKVQPEWQKGYEADPFSLGAMLNASVSQSAN